ncbi:tRNA (adenosine(37)-N6)-threonylcarbamoyltransferase complex dimerization subunit type 1 TsaB [Dysgonomonas sp. 520]|uniref:tRNA (adenosine(37)-N6)-threonylcarbamoyltransferase complex dimerization subunit type 1 TsaB n=1 Tax=Dysgonomonas sp. 520 TaxID=2302931 RepID=UPI0013D7EFC6|nr:tRNA (adenosine(37)-N6)-threonylcarbamoyltransferase complex dimerization subunit type 1 TsaB [Dysgonomonas sp. 520]NDW09130.1 tRNA (adenosine(37)-N6)-threonylcarbamoyltransferase complex dimerization subunit type 1 TsaB [Dysgonomonas sp. 520]
MPHILYIDTATEVCSVAISNNEEIIFDRLETKGPSHASLLGVFVDDAVKFLRKENKKPDAVAVSCGPGSYTGLRIGVSEAKGLCYGMDIPLIALNTPHIMAAGVAKSGMLDENTLLCPMIDARRMEVYAAIYNQKLEIVRDIQADIVDSDTYREYLKDNKIAFFGNGSAKCKEEIDNDNAIFLDNIYPKATDMISLAMDAYTNQRFEDVAYFEPFYLKEFVTTTPKKKVI